LGHRLYWISVAIPFVVLAVYSFKVHLNTRHEKEILELLNVYVSDPMGGGQPLNNKVKENVK